MRTARVKYLLGKYHIIIRSMSELLLFRDSKDKEKMLKIIKKYKDSYNFKLLSFCLMDTHAHFIIDCNGSDISKFMHGVNLSYAIYYNKKYDRHGHVFSDRFKSILLEKTSDIINCSAYIHNNPKDIVGYKNNVENYPYSSFGIYLGRAHDKHKITNISIILGFYSSNLLDAQKKKKYFEFVKSRTNNDSNKIDFNIYENDSNNYEYSDEKNYLFQDITPNDIIDFVSNYTNSHSVNAKIKFNHNTSEFRSVCCFLMRSICDLKYKDICSIIGNMSLSGISRLCSNGYSIIQNKVEYNNIIDDFVAYYQKISNKNS